MRHRKHVALLPASTVLRAAAVTLIGILASVHAEAARDCVPKMNCEVEKTCVQKVEDTDCPANAQGPPCVLKTETRDCEPHWDCLSFCSWFDVSCIGSKIACEANKASYKMACEQAKAVQNAVYAAEKKACEAEREKQHSPEQIERRRADCEAAKSAQNSIYASDFARCQDENTLARQQCERTRARLQADCEAGLRGPFSCSAVETMAMLRAAPQGFVDETKERNIALSGDDEVPWVETACQAKGKGVPYRDAVLSADGFWTIDLRLQSFTIGDLAKPKGDRFIRLVIRPAVWGGGKAHLTADEHYITKKDTIEFGGSVFIDRIPSPSLEVHVVDDLMIVAGNGPSQ